MRLINKAIPLLYYTWFHGHGRAILADDLDAEDPFGLAPGAIVDVVSKAGYTPWIEAPHPDWLPTPGKATEIEREGLSYLVTVSRDAQEIDVQELREEA